MSTPTSRRLAQSLHHCASMSEHTDVEEPEAYPDPTKDSRPVLFVGLPMAISVRDVLRTGVLDRLVEEGTDVHLFSPAAETGRLRDEFGGPSVHFHPLLRPTPGAFDYLDGLLLRVQALLLSLRCETVAIMTAASFRRQPWARAVRALLARSAPAQNALIRLIRLCYSRFTPELYADLFQRHRPDLVVGTRALTMTGLRSDTADRYLDRHLLMSAAQQRIPAMVLVASWDNLTTSGFFPTDPECISVWNEVMNEQAQRIHGIDPVRIVVTGAPQHDVYAHGPFRERKSFLSSLGLDPSRPVVAYATGTEGIIPDEPDLIEQIADRMAQAMPDTQLLVRLHQLDRRERYEVLSGRPSLVIDQAGSRASAGYPDREFGRLELERLADTLRHVDVVINFASSISIDAVALGTPVVAVDFDAHAGLPYERSGRRFYDFTHLRALLACGGVAKVADMDALIQAVGAYLSDPGRDAEGRRRLVERHCYRIDGRAGQRVAEAVLGQLRGRRPARASR